MPTPVAVAKLWYESSFPVNSSTNGKLVTQGVGTINTTVDLSQHIKPDWQHSTNYKRFGKDVIEMPIDPAGNIATALSNKPGGNAVYKKQYSRSSFILLNDGTNYEAYVMTIIADSAYLKNDLTKLDRNKYNKRDSDFSGVVLYSTPKGKFVSGWFYKNGNITSALSSLYKTYTTATSKNNGPVVQSLKTNLLQAVMTCTDWYQTYTIDGVTSDPVYLDTTCVTSYIDDGGGGGGGGLSGGSSNTGSSGGGGTTSPGTTTPCTVPTTSQSASVTKGHLTVDYIQPQPVPGATNGFPPPTSDPCATTGTIPYIPSVIDSLTDPCLIEALNLQTMNGISNNMTIMIRNIFGVDDNINLTFDQTNSYPNSLLGNTSTTLDNTINGARIFSATITLNGNVLPNSSQEYIATTIIHEAFHAYFQYNNTYYNDGLGQHLAMATMFVDQIRVDLQQTYPNLSDRDANALIINGFSSIQQSLPADFNTILSNYNLSLSDVVAIRDSYQNGSVGTKCNSN